MYTVIITYARVPSPNSEYMSVSEYDYISNHHTPTCPNTCYTTVPHRCHFLLFNTVVIACLTTTPALSTSLFDRPVVTQTFKAGCGRHSFMRSLGVAPIARGMALRRVMRTPFARALF